MYRVESELEGNTRTGFVKSRDRIGFLDLTSERWKIPMGN